LPGHPYFTKRRSHIEVPWTDTPIERLMAAHLRTHKKSVSKAVLLDVIVGRLTTWTAPGLLLLGRCRSSDVTDRRPGRISLVLRDALVAGKQPGDQPA